MVAGSTGAADCAEDVVGAADASALAESDGGTVAAATAAFAPATMLSAVTDASSGERIGASCAAVAARSGTCAGSSTIEYTRTGSTIWLLFRSTITPSCASLVRVARVCRSPSFGWITVGDQSRVQSPPDDARCQVQVAG